MRLATWADALQELDVEQVDLVSGLTTDRGRTIAELARKAGRPPHDGERIVGEALIYLGRKFVDQARSATDGRGERRGWR